MLVFVDAPKFLRVLRLNASQNRSRIGRIMKPGHEFREDEGVVVSDDERADIRNVTETLQNGDAATSRANGLRFPEAARLALEYYVASATDVEKRLIATAAQEITRAIRRAAHSGDEALDSPSPAPEEQE